MEIRVKNDFAKGAVWRHILLQAGPLTVAQLVQILYNVIDRIYIGHLPDTNGAALTGLGIVFPIITIVAAFTNLFGMGGAPLFSIVRGKQDKETAGKIMGNTFALLCISSVFIMIFCYIFQKPILYTFGASDVTYKYAKDYLSIYLLGTIFSMVGTGMNSFISAQGFPKIAMCTTVIGAILNMILDPFFIFGLDMGVKGAALATVIAQMCSAIWVVRFLTGKYTLIRLRLALLRLEPALVKSISALGLSGFIMSATNCAVQIACNRMLSIYGGDLYIGIMTILNSVREIVSLPVMGLTSGSQPVLGFNYGAKQYERVRSGIRFTALLGAAYTLLVWIVIMLVPEFFLRMFGDNADTITYGVPALKLYFFGFFLMSFQFAGQSTFTALGRAKYAVFFSLLRKAVIVVPLTIILPQIASLGVDGVFLAEPISNAIGGSACLITMLHTVYRELGRNSKACITSENL
ncbi:MAG: MATE family efflux transporter [Lachnospiraceae bacterium]|nr:MATE family efflux transporter [Lachnospiraceae bacterium]